jgi:hypothetical protein
MFWKRTIWWILLGVVVLALLGIGGVAIYRAGYTHGAMADFTLPEGSELPAFPYGRTPFAYGRHIGPRAGLFGFFPLLFCFGGLFLLMLAFGSCRRMFYRKYAGKGHWKHHGPHPYWHGGPWEAGKPPWAEDQPETESDAPSVEAEEAEG